MHMTMILFREFNDLIAQAWSVPCSSYSLGHFRDQPSLYASSILRFLPTDHKFHSGLGEKLLFSMNIYTEALPGPNIMYGVGSSENTCTLPSSLKMSGLLA